MEPFYPSLSYITHDKKEIAIGLVMIGAKPSRRISEHTTWLA